MEALKDVYPEFKHSAGKPSGGRRQDKPLGVAALCQCSQCLSVINAAPNISTHTGNFVA